MDGLAASGVELRPAAPEDSDLIWRILCIASAWREDPTPTELSNPNPAYYEDWGRPDDIGVLAFRGIEFAGGAYARRVGPADGTYGYIDPECLEVGMGIESHLRGQGLGRLVLEVLKAKVMERGYVGLSLSAERDNLAAIALYHSARFSVVKERETDLLMGWNNPMRSTP